ncbi:MAG: DUF1640 domain-containing protein [Magnetococcales bacterium]|nr:DUF1640 domain-containing protein [Magnetococcales bacterium]
MAVMAFDTLKYFKRLRAAGVPPQQAEVLVEGMAEALEGYFAASKERPFTRAEEQRHADRPSP